MDAPMRRLLPEPAADLAVTDAYAAPLGRRDDRPWVGLSMVSSIDGSIAVSGTSAGLSSPTDLAVLWQLRELADAIFVGAGTVRDEGYGPPRKQGQRIGVVTGSGRVDLTSELFTSGAGFLVTTESAELDLDGIEVDVVRAGHDSVDLALAIERIGELVPACSTIQAEGGARLNGALLDADLLDEINVTTSPGAVGGDGPRLTSGAGEQARRFELAQLALDEQSFLYSRWLRTRR
ncbi:MAG TPA: dihydrofolate reductase family protein [Ilumatobacteraceae bacterium]|nr:dihydrofolate reductase family protein [Ilumatobacteraceae bacterium]